MGLFKKLLHREPSDDGSGPSVSGPSGPYEQPQAPEKKTVAGTNETFAPPPGPPPSYNAGASTGPTEYAPPEGHPPSRGLQAEALANDGYLPPSGPPPSHQAACSPLSQNGYLPPPDPPPSHQNPLEQAPPGYHDWQTAVPDTSLLPPPPSVANDFSKTSNADASDANRARDWCRVNPLRPARHPQAQQIKASHSGAVKLISPGSRMSSGVTELSEGVWSGATTTRAPDLCFTTSLPLYYALAPDSPKLSGKPFATYFELHVNRVGQADRDGNLPSLAIGFVAAPYPTWRLPGWERGSLAVHSDDGCRYINNQDGGLDFVAPFKAGDVVGLGIRFWNEGWGGGASNTLKGEAFFTRNGQVEGSWSLQEEKDAEDLLGIVGVEGDHDLFGAIGTFGEVGFKAVFKRAAWAFQPPVDQFPGL